MKVNKRGRKAVIAGAVAASALAVATLSQGTLALWTDQATVATGATVNSGNLDVGVIGSPAWTVNGSPVTPSAYTMVPGDVMIARQSFAVALKGQQAKANIAVSPVAPTGAMYAGSAVDVDATETGTAPNGIGQDTTSTSGLVVTYTVTDKLGAAVAGCSDLPISSTCAINNIVPTTAGINQAISSPAVASETSYSVEMTLTFDGAVSERTRALASAVINGTTVTVTQIR